MALLGRRPRRDARAADRRRGRELAGLGLVSGNARPLDVLAAGADGLPRLRRRGDEGAGGGDEGGDREGPGARPGEAPRRRYALSSGRRRAYWLDLAAYDPAAAARSLASRCSSSQGGRDYEVTRRTSRDGGRLWLGAAERDVPSPPRSSTTCSSRGKAVEPGRVRTRGARLGGGRGGDRRVGQGPPGPERPVSDPGLVFKALADPTRRRILEYLREGDLNAGEIAERFDMTKPSISHHLSLPEAGATSSRTSGAARTSSTPRHDGLPRGPPVPPRNDGTEEEGPCTPLNRPARRPQAPPGRRSAPRFPRAARGRSVPGRVSA